MNRFKIYMDCPKKLVNILKAFMVASKNAVIFHHSISGLDRK